MSAFYLYFSNVYIYCENSVAQKKWKIHGFENMTTPHLNLINLEKVENDKKKLYSGKVVQQKWSLSPHFCCSVVFKGIILDINNRQICKGHGNQNFLDT